MLRVQAMDHAVLRVADVERSVAWYRDVLGLDVLRLEEWRDGKVPFPSVRVSEDTIIDIQQAERTGTNIDHLCLACEPTDFEALKASGTVDVLSGPAVRWGARGDALSLYVRDPDGNVIELRHYGPREGG